MVTQILSSVTNLDVAPASGVASLTLSPVAGQESWVYTSSGPVTSNGISMKTNASARWALFKNNVTESGSDVGSDFVIYCYDNTGTYLWNPIYIQRNTGRVLVARDPVDNLGVATKQYTDTRAVPTGGTTGQVLAKNSNTNYDIGWTTGGGGGLDQATADARYVNLDGDTMIGPLTVSNAGGHLVFKTPGRKSWLIFGDASTDKFILTPSATVNGTDWDWGKGLSLIANGSLNIGGYSSSSNPGDVNCGFVTAENGGAFNGSEVWNIGTPTAGTSAANKSYVDARTPKITVSTTAPSSPAVGDCWIDSN